ncbi:MAG: hypothetical protein HFJ25_06635 [Clostridia bacterium]|nr:hypothetical protein [Clostridia bacterium]
MLNSNQSLYLLSNRDYLDDYSHVKIRKIDMTLSGNYLSNYPFEVPKSYSFDQYPNKEIEILIQNILKKYPLQKKKKIVLGLE